MLLQKILMKKKLKEREDFENDLNEVLWESDSVTGNGSGSYTFSREWDKK